MPTKPFHQCAIPHKDILEGNFSMETYAAKLGEVHRKSKTCPDEYLDSKIFFKRTFHTKSFQNILNDVKARLDGDRKKDSFNNVQTPFGGGKTHTLIGLLHKAKEWNAKTVVLDGIEMDPNTETFWGSIEKQLDGKIQKLTGQVPHGSTKLAEVLQKHQPLLILIDEAMHYVNAAKGIKVEKDTLADSTVNFFPTANRGCIKIR